MLTLSRKVDECKALVSGAPDVTYEVDALRFSTLARAVEDSPIHYANIKSKVVQVEIRVCTHGIRRPSLWFSDSMPTYSVI